jgi:hypothetical protein
MNINYKERIENLKDRIEKSKEKLETLEQCNKLYNYFYPVRKSQNSYIVEMRRVVGQQLYDLGMSKLNIAGIFSKDHSTIIHLLNIESNIAIEKEVANKYKLWIELNLYPDSVFVVEPSDIHKQGSKHTLEYKLRDKLIYEKNSKEKFVSISVSKYFKERMLELIDSEDYVLCRAGHTDSLIEKIKFSHPNLYKSIEEKENQYQQKMLLLNATKLI